MVCATDNQHKDLDLEKVTAELRDVKSRVIRELKEGTFHLNTNKAKVRLRAETVVAEAMPQCEEGTEPATEGDYCGNAAFTLFWWFNIV